MEGTKPRFFHRLNQRPKQKTRQRRGSWGRYLLPTKQPIEMPKKGKTNNDKGNGYDEEGNYNNGKKPTNEELARRKLKVLDLVIKGYSPEDIRLYVQNETDWGVSTHTIDKYRLQAAELLKERAKTVADEQIGLAIARLNFLFKKCEMRHNHKTALAAQKELIELLGLKKQDGSAGATVVSININKPKEPKGNQKETK